MSVIELFWSSWVSINMSRSLVSCLLIVAALNSTGCVPVPDPQGAEVLLVRARLRRNTQQPQEAVDILTKAIELHPDEEVLYYERALTYVELGESEQALADYAAAIEQKPDFAEALNNRAALLAELGRYDEAAAGFGKVIEANSQDALAYRNRGLAYHDLQEFELAIADYDRALKLEPNSVDNWFMCGNACLEAGRTEDAIRCFTAVIYLNPQEARAFLRRSTAYEQLGKNDVALHDRHRAAEIDAELVAREEAVDAAPIPLMPMPVAVPAPVAMTPVTSTESGNEPAMESKSSNLPVPVPVPMPVPSKADAAVPGADGESTAEGLVPPLPAPREIPAEQPVPKLLPPRPVE